MKPPPSWRRVRTWPALVLIVSIRIYRVTLSGWLGGQCRFYPSCSHYAEEAIAVHGAVRGTAKAMWRVLRCNPFGAGGVDPAERALVYEHVTPMVAPVTPDTQTEQASQP